MRAYRSAVATTKETSECLLVMTAAMPSSRTVGTPNKYECKFISVCHISESLETDREGTDGDKTATAQCYPRPSLTWEELGLGLLRSAVPLDLLRHVDRDPLPARPLGRAPKQRHTQRRRAA